MRKGLDDRLGTQSLLSLQDQHNYMLSILMRQDKMSMAASIESRVPFLDFRIIEFANSLPTHFKNRGFTTKKILKRIAKSYLPDEIVHRRKSGFGVPLDRWLRNERGMGRYLISISKNPLLTEYFDNKKVEKLVEQHRSGLMDHSDLLWALVNFVVWRERFGM